MLRGPSASSWNTSRMAERDDTKRSRGGTHGFLTGAGRKADRQLRNEQREMAEGPGRPKERPNWPPAGALGTGPTTTGKLPKIFRVYANCSGMRQDLEREALVQGGAADASRWNDETTKARRRTAGWKATTC